MDVTQMDKPSQQQVSNSIRIGHIYLQHLLHIAKYYLLDFTIPFFPLPHFVYEGVLDINIVVVYLLCYTSVKCTTVEFVVP